ncbi:hypothetical protein BDB00DRAFT_812722 [Zychaea mexicana]|uniref:uncharacterized protein n=1 Tax=Zychaea mexicana TaxID=64656 RepID=UPI0022FE2DF1|nr:uncharacterized protein BDB00DRAFT_812722 [Zychaea mexicana]KAI9495633.1 hypothetical protein BDB00DRAFT_812722 [Zychaea mexicana]
MNESFAFNDTFSTSEDPMEDMFPPLNEDGQITFDALAIANHDNNNNSAQEEIDSQENDLLQFRQDSSSDSLWHDVDSLSNKSGNNNNNNEASLSSATACDTGDGVGNNKNTAAGLRMQSDNDSGTTSTLSATAIGSKDSMSAQQQAEASAVFNISWGGNDKPPAELHLEQPEESEIVSRRPLPKPRGVRRLPEPEPAEDGTLDEDTLRRRRNTYAARRSRMKKFLKIENLENRVNQLQTENAKLVLNNALLESEKRGWMAKEAEYKKRIKLLECPSDACSASGTPPADTEEQQWMDIQ